MPRITSQEYAAAVEESTIRGVDEANAQLVHGMQILEAGRAPIEALSFTELRKLRLTLGAHNGRGREALIENIMHEARRCDWTVQTYHKRNA